MVRDRFRFSLVPALAPPAVYHRSGELCDLHWRRASPQGRWCASFPFLVQDASRKVCALARRHISVITYATLSDPSDVGSMLVTRMVLLPWEQPDRQASRVPHCSVVSASLADFLVGVRFVDEAAQRLGHDDGIVLPCMVVAPASTPFAMSCGLPGDVTFCDDWVNDATLDVAPCTPSVATQAAGHMQRRAPLAGQKLQDQQQRLQPPCPRRQVPIQKTKLTRRCAVANAANRGIRLPRCGIEGLVNGTPV